MFLDFAGTLAFNDPPRAWHYLRCCASRGVFLNRRDVWAALRDVWMVVDSKSILAHPEASRDSTTYDAFRAAIEGQILERLGVRWSQEAIIQELLRTQDDPMAYTLYPETTATLARLQSAGYQLGIVSNFTWALPDLVHSLGLSPYISTVITSARVGYRKPHQKIFAAAAEAAGADPARSLFVGDSFEADVGGALGYGFQPILVDRRRSGRHEWPSIAFLSDLELLLPLPATA